MNDDEIARPGFVWCCHHRLLRRAAAPTHRRRGTHLVERRSKVQAWGNGSVLIVQDYV